MCIPGIPVGIIACVLCWVLIYRTSIGFAGRVTGGNIRAAQLQGLPVARLIMLACALGGACAGLAGTIEVAAEYGRANASLNAGYGYTGILIAFLARFNPLAIMPMAILLGGLGAAGGLLQRRMGSAGRNGAGAARDDLRLDPGERHAVRPLSAGSSRAGAPDGRRDRHRHRRWRHAGGQPARQHAVPVRQPSASA